MKVRKYKIKYRWQVFNLADSSVLASGMERTADLALDAAESVTLKDGVKTRIEISPVHIPRKSLRATYSSERW